MQTTSFVNAEGQLTVSSSKNNCSDLTRVFEIIKKRDEYLNSDTLPATGVTREELIEMIRPTIHVIATKNWCASSDLLDEYYAKLGLQDS